MKLYLSGPMSGLPELNFPAFHAEAKSLREKGHEVVNPAEFEGDGTWGDWILLDLLRLKTGDFGGLVQLPGWENSPGCKIEMIFAQRLGIQIFRQGEI